MSRLLFAKYIDDSTGSFEYYFRGIGPIFSSESLSESEVDDLLHLLAEDDYEKAKCN